MERLEASVTEVSRETSAAILHQEERFVGSMEVIGAQLERRDSQNADLLQGLLGALDRNTSTIEKNPARTDANTEVMTRAVHLIEAQAATIARLEQRLLDVEGDCESHCASSPSYADGISHFGHGAHHGDESREGVG